MRNPYPFTKRQINLLKALAEKITEINDHCPEIITHDSYEWKIEQTKFFGKIPKIKFFPHSCQIKAELVRKSELTNENREKKLSEIRQKYGIKERRHSHARLFEAEFNNIMLKLKKAVYTVGYINNLFTVNGNQVAEPLALLQQIVLEEQAQSFKDNNRDSRIKTSDKP